MAEKEKPWLPENYQNFLRVSGQFDAANKLRIVICAGAVIATYFLIPQENRNIMTGPIIGFTLGLLTEPSYPILNPWGRRLYLERLRLAKDISTKERWTTIGISDDQLVKRAKATLTLTGELTPLQKGVKSNLTPDRKISNFDKQFRRTNLQAKPGDNRDNMNLAVARKALIFAEDYWKSVNPVSPISQAMIENIRRYRSYLSTERHISFQNHN